MTRLALLLPLVVLVGCKDDPPPPKAKTAPTPAAKAGDTTPPAFDRGGNTNYQAGGGATQAVRQAARRTVALNDMKNLGTYIADLELQNNRMPTKADIVAAVKSDATVSKLIADGTIILTGTTKRAGLWAYEAEADTKGGIGLVGGTPNRHTADEIKTHLQNN